METLLNLGLDAAAAGLGLLLGLVALQASREYRERRFALVGLALLLLAAIGVVGALGGAVSNSPPGFALGELPSALVVVAELLLLGSLALGRRPGPDRG